MKCFRRCRRRKAAEAFQSALADGARTAEHDAMLRVVAALQPAQPLNETRRDAAKAAMLRAAALAELEPTADAGSMDAYEDSPAVHTAEVILDGLVVRVADVEAVDRDRAVAAAAEVARHTHARFGDR